MTMTAANVLPDLLAHDAWARRPAGRLLHAHGPEGPVQDSWVALSRRPMPEGVRPRTWLAGVLRNLARLGRRTSGRRRAREEAAALLAVEPDRPDQAAERRESQRCLARLVLALDPLYRE